MKKSINKAIYFLLAVSIAFSALLFTVQAQNVTSAQLQAQIAQLQQQLAQAQQSNQTAQAIQLQQQIDQLQQQLNQQTGQFTTGLTAQQLAQTQQLQQQITQLQQQIQTAQQANKTQQAASLQQQLTQKQTQLLIQFLEFKSGVSLSDFTPGVLQQQLVRLQNELVSVRQKQKTADTTALQNQIKQIQQELQSRNKYCQDPKEPCISGGFWNGASGDFAMFDSSKLLGDNVLLRVDFKGGLSIPKDSGDTSVIVSAYSASGMFDEASEASTIIIAPINQLSNEHFVQMSPFFGLPYIKKVSGVTFPLNQEQYSRYCLEVIGECSTSIRIVGTQTGKVYYQSADFSPNIPLLLTYAKNPFASSTTQNPFASSTRIDVNYVGKEASGLSATSFVKSSVLGKSISELLIVCDGGRTKPCTFDSAMELLQNVIKLLLTKVAFLMFLAGLFYAGWTFLTSQGNPGVRKEVRDRLWSLLKGYLIALCAWVIVKTIIVIFAGEKPSFDVFF